MRRRLETPRSTGRRRSDFLRPVLAAVLVALATNAAQATWQHVSSAEERAWYADYVRGLAARCVGR